MGLSGAARLDLTRKQAKKVGTVMREYKHGTLKSGSGRKVRRRKQAVAIALSKARRV